LIAGIESAWHRASPYEQRDYLEFHIQRMKKQAKADE
jgi:hypothetical protein